MGVILAATIVIAPKEAPYNQVLLLAPILLVVSYWSILWAAGALSRLALAVTALIVAWPWLAALGITLASIFVPNPKLQRAWELPLYSTILIPLAVFAVVTIAIMKLLPRWTNVKPS